MFTGIIEAIGTVSHIDKKRDLITMSLRLPPAMARGMKIGDSLAVDGVCLTLSHKRGVTARVDIMRETMAKTTLSGFKKGQPVNMERALKVGSRLGGHFVQGHVDGVGRIARVIQEDNYVEVRIRPPKALSRFLVPKGSVAIDGISLTVGKVGKQDFSVYLIPHTLAVTTLGRKRKGDAVNIETDLVAKHIIRLIDIGELNPR